MIAFAHIDAQGFPTGGGVLPQLPDGAVPLSAPFTTADLPRLRWQDGVWVERLDLTPAAPVDVTWAAVARLGQIRAEARAEVNARVARLRARAETPIPGQADLYRDKRAEALAFVRTVEQAGEPVPLEDFPLLAGEVGITAPTPWQLAQIWLHRADAARRLRDGSEALRQAALAAIAIAPDAASIDAVLTRLSTALAGLQP